jgi:hypothetical protein
MISVTAKSHTATRRRTGIVAAATALLASAGIAGALVMSGSVGSDGNRSAQIAHTNPSAPASAAAPRSDALQFVCAAVGGFGVCVGPPIQ